VDDTILTNYGASCVDKVQLTLSSLFKYFLDLEITKFSKDASLSKIKYILYLLDDIGFIGGKLATLPIDPNLKLSLNDSDPIENLLCIKDYLEDLYKWLFLN